MAKNKKIKTIQKELKDSGLKIIDKTTGKAPSKEHTLADRERIHKSRKSK